MSALQEDGTFQPPAEASRSPASAVGGSPVAWVQIRILAGLLCRTSMAAPNTTPSPWYKGSNRGLSLTTLLALLLADRTAYAVHPLPLSDVQALRKHVPSFGTHHVVVVLGNGLTLPPLFFTQGGVRAMFAALKQVHCPAQWLLETMAHGRPCAGRA